MSDRVDVLTLIADWERSTAPMPMVDILRVARDEIERLREERLTNEERAAICWARAGLLNDADETKSRGLRERSEHSRNAAETLTRLLERQPLPPEQETKESCNG